jgi:hypothetical protein
MMVATRDEGGPGRAAQGGRVEAVVAQPLGREPVHRGRRHAAAERAELAEPDIVEQDQDDVGRAFWRLHRLRELRRVGIEIGAPDGPGEVEVGPWQHARGTEARGCVGLGIGLGESRARKPESKRDRPQYRPHDQVLLLE